MKKRILPLILLIVLILTTSANAYTERTAGNSAKLTFDGTKAHCKVVLSTTNLKGDISAVIELWSGTTRINFWEESADSGYLVFDDDTTVVEKGKSYTLTVTYSVDGKEQPLLSASAICK